MKFPVQGTSVQHWDFSQDLLDRIENRRVDVRKAKRRKKLIPWKKIIPLIYCPFYTDFELATAKIESDHFDALATFRARRDATGKQVMLHDSTARKSAPTSKYSNEVDLSVVRQSRDMLANCLRDEPTVWEHYLLEDNPQLYKTGQYLRTGDMTGYVLQERPFYHHFDPDKESADDPHDSYSFVEKNEDRTLYTFKKPPKGTALTRLAPLIRVPVNKYANPRNRNIEDVCFYLKQSFILFHFKEQIVLNPAEPDMHTADLKKLAEEVGKQIERENLELEESLSSDFSTSKANQDGENEAFSANNDSSVLSRLLAKHQQHSQDLERLRDELRQHARSCCSKTAKECVEWTDSLNKAALGEQVDDDELVDWKTSRFLETVGPLREKTFLETLKEKFALEFCEAETNSNTRRRTRVMTAIWGTGHNALELRVPDNAIFNNAFHFIKRGIHKDLQYVDATYHMKIFKFKVTVEQAHESLR
ncbi:hypothetical protein ANCCAN_02166 [Ancylostoma caninum]|uniref:Uncharacterized protein n=1 Tax=Ancylostoma caninum TaxID=29170 RepID=A0A368H5D1_ANCCA|nr:hypothetical protein ANCCAN_02166 [Ancylostoma caninum]